MKQHRITGNDVLDFDRYYNGKEESPVFRKQYIDIKNKLFVPVDDLGLLSLSNNISDEVILHQFVKDTKQNNFVIKETPPINLFQKVYAVASSDLSVDSSKSYEVFNLSNILKSRINAYRLQNEFGLLVILTLIWGNEKTFDYAFGNIEKGSIVAVSSQAIKNSEVFRKGFCQAIKIIEPGNICWYGKIFDWVKEYYNPEKIVKMQTRSQLIKRKAAFDKEKYQGELFSA